VECLKRAMTISVRCYNRSRSARNESIEVQWISPAQGSGMGLIWLAFVLCLYCSEVVPQCYYIGYLSRHLCWIMWHIFLLVFFFFLNCPPFSFSCVGHMSPSCILSLRLLDSVLMITAFLRDPLLFWGFSLLRTLIYHFK
jgi:hypothetical protein